MRNCSVVSLPTIILSHSCKFMDIMWLPILRSVEVSDLALQRADTRDHGSVNLNLQQQSSPSQDALPAC